MSTKMLVRKDDEGLYIKHGDEKARPVANDLFDFYRGADNNLRHIVEVEEGITIAHNGESKFHAGDHVKKNHISQTTIVEVRDMNRDYTEWWFIEFSYGRRPC